MASKTPNTQSSNGVKTNHYDSFHYRILPPIEDLSTCRVIRGKRPTIQTIIIFVGEYNYERPHTDDDILYIEARHPIKQIMTKCLN
jgi:hypothetical protein